LLWNIETSPHPPKHQFVQKKSILLKIHSTDCLISAHRSVFSPKKIKTHQVSDRKSRSSSSPSLVQEPTSVAGVQQNRTAAVGRAGGISISPFLLSLTRFQISLFPYVCVRVTQERVLLKPLTCPTVFLNLSLFVPHLREIRIGAFVLQESSKSKKRVKNQLCGHLVQGGGNETHRKWWLTLGFAGPELPGSWTPKGRALRSLLQDQFLTHSSPEAAFEARETERLRCLAALEGRATGLSFQ